MSNLNEHYKNNSVQYSLFDTPVEHGITVKSYIPTSFSKQLKIGNFQGQRRIRLSSNILQVMGWDSGVRTQMRALGDFKGIEITKDQQGKTKIYQRTYKKRKNNPFETQIDIQNQSLINQSIANYINELHFNIQKDKIVITPLNNRTFHIRKNMKHISDYEAFVAMSSGIDMYSLLQTGFKISGLLEYRPQEKRDNRDFTETGVMCALAQGEVRNVFNEDITKVDWNRIKNQMANSEPVALAHISLQCDDFSNAKANKLKQRSLDTLDTSMDLVYDALRMIEELSPGVILVENVEGFANSYAGELLVVKLRKWGYNVSEKILSANLNGGLTKRKRYYLVASVFPGFEFPKEEKSLNTAWNIVKPYLNELREVSTNKAVIDGFEQNRIRLIREGDIYAPTILKSQNRMAKDSIYIEHQGKIFFPNEEILRELSGFPRGLDLNSNGRTIASEIIGQSIDYPMHDRLIKSIHRHIRDNKADSSVVKLSNSLIRKVC